MTKGFVKMKEGCYAARINRDGKRHHLGTFRTAEEARACYDENVRLFGEPGKPGRPRKVSREDLLNRKVDFLNNLVRSLQARVESLEKSR